MSTDYDYLLKFIIIGDSNVGKSAIVQRFVNEFFSESDIPTIGIDFKIKLMDLKNKKIKLQIWDTAGEERFRTITSSYYRGAHGIIMVYDITNLESFNNIVKWANEVERYAKCDAVKIIVGNKCDRLHHREVKYEEGKEFAQELNMSFIEVSAKNDINVNDIFETLAGLILEDVIDEDDEDDDNIIDISIPRQVEKHKHIGSCSC